MQKLGNKIYSTVLQELLICFIIIDPTANTQFGQEMALVMQTTHAQPWQYPDRVDKHLFSSIEMCIGITKILEFE